MSSPKLPPIDFKEDVQKYEAYTEKTELAFGQHKHKAVYDKKKSELRCDCGAAWSGERLNELLEGLDKSK